MSADDEIRAGKRFAFGANWTRFLEHLDDDRIAEAERSLRKFLGVEGLDGKSLLDIGCGSGLFSLAARRMGARVHSFDFDDKSVACALELRRRYFPNDANWTVEKGSALDRGYVESLGQVDVCYSWGVLHHTGQLWRALFNAQAAVTPGGLLYIAIYNDQGLTSAVWGVIKRIYCSNALGMAAVTSIFYPAFFLAGLFLDLFQWRNPAKRYREHRQYRGMSLIHDWKDWLGGLPYEPARPERIEGFLHNLGFGSLRFERPVFGFGNCQYVFRRRL